MRISRSLIVGLAGMIAAAGAAEAQTSLFGQPTSPAPSLSPPPSAASAPRAKPKPRGPVPARALAVTNDTTATVTGLEVTAEGKTAKLGKPLGPKAKTTLRLPPMKSCMVTVMASLDGADADTTSQDVCKDRSIRFIE